ncbi:MAG: PIN domain-containing protein [Thermodesulfobacteriota bacterium]|nr:PIN domain-containing protein [Thermodesulfobacteriota bacterium]
MSDNTVFLDSNIVVYAYDRHAPDKMVKAQSLLKSGIAQENAVVSSQVLGEFFVVVTQRIKEPLSADDAMRIIEILSVLPIVEIDLSLVKHAIQTHKMYGISYWDSLILAAAEYAGCGRLISEDLSDGQEYNGIIVENPFR